MLEIRSVYTDRITVYETVRDYLASPHWQFSRAMWRAAHPDACCFICGRRDFDLHHLTYARVGAERHEDLVPLCEDHHHEVEKLVARRIAPRAKAHFALEAAYLARAGRRTHEVPIPARERLLPMGGAA